MIIEREGWVRMQENRDGKQRSNKESYGEQEKVSLRGRMIRRTLINFFLKKKPRKNAKENRAGQNDEEFIRGRIRNAYNRQNVKVFEKNDHRKMPKENRIRYFARPRKSRRRKYFFNVIVLICKLQPTNQQET